MVHSCENFELHPKIFPPEAQSVTEQTEGVLVGNTGDGQQV
jgi:hypothetical protein